MIRKFYILLINLFFISCIDLITDEEFYESIYLNKSGWFEFYENNQNQNISLPNYFTFQIWLSGNSDLDLEAPCILNINNTYWDLAIYKNSNSNNFLMIYGPFIRTTIQTSQSNLNFDQSLKSQNPLWGLRHLDEVNKLALENGFKLDKVIEMPANNLSVIYRFD